MTIGEFREVVREKGQYRDECLSYRKSLDERWDYNAVAGILIGSKIRHTSGVLHALEQNIGIGQGDNGNHVVLKLNEKGLTAVFDKYEKNTTELLSDAENDILNIAPEYKEIIEFINDTFVEAKNKTAYKTVTDEVLDDIMDSIIPMYMKLASENVKMPYHKEYYSFPGVRMIENGQVQKKYDCFYKNWQSLIQEYEGYLWYIEVDNEYERIHRMPIYEQNKNEVVISIKKKHENVLQELDGTMYHLGSIARLSVNEGRLYFSRAQLEGRSNVYDTADNNMIYSLDIDKKVIDSYMKEGKVTLRKEFELIDPKRKKTLYNPYIINNKAIVKVVSESGAGSLSAVMLDKHENEQCVYRYAEGDYLAINEQECIIDSDVNTAVYNMVTGEKNSISNVYNGSKNKDIIYIDAQKDILYYFENKDDVCGKIIGISKDGKVVDEVQPVADSQLRNLLKTADGSFFSFDGETRVYKLTSLMKYGDLPSDNSYRDSLYVANREGECEERFSYDYVGVDNRRFMPEVHIHKSSAVVLYFEEHNNFMEYMITTKGEVCIKPLFS